MSRLKYTDVIWTRCMLCAKLCLRLLYLLRPWHRVNEYERVDKGIHWLYRTAYYDYPRCQHVVVWFGLHYIVMALYWLWVLSYWYPRCRRCRYCENLSTTSVRTAYTTQLEKASWKDVQERIIKLSRRYDVKRTVAEANEHANAVKARCLKCGHLMMLADASAPCAVCGDVGPHLVETGV